MPHSMTNIDMTIVDISYEEHDDDTRKTRTEAMKSAALVFKKQDRNGDGVMDLREV